MKISEDIEDKESFIDNLIINSSMKNAKKLKTLTFFFGLKKNAFIFFYNH